MNSIEITTGRCSLFLDVIAAVSGQMDHESAADTTTNPRGLSWRATKRVLRDRCRWTDIVFDGLRGPYPSTQRWAGVWRGLFMNRATLRGHAEHCSATYHLPAIAWIASDECNAHERLLRMIASSELTEVDFTE